MSEIDKMLESLSKADINYRDKLIIDMGENHQKYRYSITEKAEHYKKPRFRFVPVLALSLMIIAGTGIFLRSSIDIAPPLDSSGETTTEYMETAYTEINDDCKKFFGIEEDIENMNFSLYGTYNGESYAYLNSESNICAVSDKALCADILNTAAACVTGTEKPYGEYGSMISYSIPFKSNNVNQIRLELPENTKTRIDILSDKNGELLITEYLGKEKTVCCPLAEGTADIIAQKLIDYAKKNNLAANQGTGGKKESFDALDVPEKLLFRTEYYYNSEKQSCINISANQYFISESDILSEIMDMISENRIKQTRFLELNGTSYTLDSSDYSPSSFYLDYSFFLSSGYQAFSMISPNQLLFKTEDDSTVYALITSDYDEALMIKQGDYVSYYTMKTDTYGRIFDIVSELIEKKESRTDIPDDETDNEYIYNRIIHASNYFETAEGELSSTFSYDNVEFSVNMKNTKEGFGYERTEKDSQIQETYLIGDGNTITYYPSKKYIISKTDIQSNGDFLCGSGMTECLNSTQLATVFLSDRSGSSWKITGFEKYLDYDCAVIEGHMTEPFKNVSDFKFLVEKNRGIVMKFEGCNSSGSLVHHMTVSKLKIDEGNSFTKEELKKRADLSNYPDYEEIKIEVTNQ